MHGPSLVASAAPVRANALIERHAHRAVPPPSTTEQLGRAHRVASSGGKGAQHELLASVEYRCPDRKWSRDVRHLAGEHADAAA